MTPSVSQRILSSGLEVFSFYKYSDISKFLKLKHTYHGFEIYKILAKNSIERFFKEFKTQSIIYTIPIDDKVVYDYSHTAILAKFSKTKNILPLYNSLRAKNSVNYSNQTLDFRLKNPRDFEYRFRQNIDAILIDDIITTGTTLNEAYNKLKTHKVNTLFALTLADAKL